MKKNTTPPPDASIPAPPPFACASVIGHRGAAGPAPENTLVAFRTAHELGARWIECDVKLTKDGVPIIFHDDTLDRTTNGKGPVAAMNWRDIKTLDAGAFRGRRFVGEGIPALADAVAVMQNLGLHVNFEIKPCPGREVETARIVLAELRRLWPAHPGHENTLLISSFSLAALEIARDMAADWPRGLLLHRIPRNWPLLVDVLRPTSLNINSRLLTAGRIRDLRERSGGLPITAYTVNGKTQAQSLWRHGVASLFTDYPDRLLQAYKRFS